MHRGVLVDAVEALLPEVIVERDREGPEALVSVEDTLCRNIRAWSFVARAMAR